MFLVIPCCYKLNIVERLLQIPSESFWPVERCKMESGEFEAMQGVDKMPLTTPTQAKMQ